MSTDAMSSLDCTGFRRVTASTTSVLMMLMHTSAAPRTCPRTCRLVGQGPPSSSALTSVEASQKNHAACEPEAFADKSTCNRQCNLCTCTV